jgi:hypothetical protein
MEEPVNINRKCKATLTIGILITEPIGQSKWRPVHVNNDSITVELDGFNHQDLIGQIYEKLQELKQLWGQNKTAYLENLQVDAQKQKLRIAES